MTDHQKNSAALDLFNFTSNSCEAIFRETEMFSENNLEAMESIGVWGRAELKFYELAVRCFDKEIQCDTEKIDHVNFRKEISDMCVQYMLSCLCKSKLFYLMAYDPENIEKIREEEIWVRKHREDGDSLCKGLRELVSTYPK